jgi:hypothetical protein
MTVIPINDRYRIELDTHSWQISKLKRHKKYPDGYWQGVVWFPRLSQCYEWLTEQGLRESDVQGAAEVVRVLSGLVASLEASIQRSDMENSWLAEQKRVAVAKKENAASSASANGASDFLCLDDHPGGRPRDKG